MRMAGKYGFDTQTVSGNALGIFAPPGKRLDSFFVLICCTFILFSIIGGKAHMR